MVVTVADSLDLVTATQKDLGKGKLSQIAQAFPNYPFVDRIMNRDQVKFHSGTSIQRTIMYKTSGAARHVGMFTPDVVNVANVLATIDIPWRHNTTNYAFEHREFLVNRTPAQIVDLIKVRRLDSYLSLAELFEASAWAKPTDSSDKVTPMGLPYWVVKGASQGFNGLNPAGFTSGAGGLDSATYTTWANWTDVYTTVSKDDLISKMRLAFRKIDFKQPTTVKEFRTGLGRKLAIFMNLETLQALEQLAEAQNESLGRDIASMDGQTVFRGLPMQWIPALDSDTTDPIYMIDTRHYYPVFLEGDYLRESKPAVSPDQHNTLVVHVDCTWNLYCDDRRRQAVISK